MQGTTYEKSVRHSAVPWRAKGNGDNPYEGPQQAFAEGSRGQPTGAMDASVSAPHAVAIAGDQVNGYGDLGIERISPVADMNFPDLSKAQRRLLVQIHL